jgi:hypothetical protein
LASHESARRVPRSFVPLECGVSRDDSVVGSAHRAFVAYFHAGGPRSGRSTASSAHLRSKVCSTPAMGPSTTPLARLRDGALALAQAGGGVEPGRDALVLAHCATTSSTGASAGSRPSTSIDNRKTGVVAGAGAWGTIHPAYRVYARAVGFHVDACPPRTALYGPWCESRSEGRRRPHRTRARRFKNHWGERGDSNPRPPGPQPGALTG